MTPYEKEQLENLRRTMDRMLTLAPDNLIDLVTHAQHLIQEIISEYGQD